MPLKSEREHEQEVYKQGYEAGEKAGLLQGAGSLYEEEAIDVAETVFEVIGNNSIRRERFLNSIADLFEVNIYERK